MEYFNATPSGGTNVLTIGGLVLTIDTQVLTIGDGAGSFNQILNVIPRESLTTGTLEITDEFTQVVTSIEVTGTYTNGFFIADFVFEPKLNSFYKLKLYKDNIIVWQGKAKAIA